MKKIVKRHLGCINKVLVEGSIGGGTNRLSKYKCVKCGNTKNLQIDHIKPFSLGGETKLKNLQILCKNCNSKKRNND